MYLAKYYVNEKNTYRQFNMCVYVFVWQSLFKVPWLSSGSHSTL